METLGFGGEKIKKRRPVKRNLELEVLEDRYLLAAGQTGVISGLVFLDANSNGLREIGEIGVSTIQITLSGTTSDNATVSLSTFTDSAGKFAFFQMKPGTYQVTRESGFTDTGLGLGSLGANPGPESLGSITLADGQTAVDYLFGIRGRPPETISLRMFLASTPPSTLGTGGTNANGSTTIFADSTTGKASLEGLIYNDVNNNGTRDDGESPLAGTTLTLSGETDAGQQQVFQTVISQADGTYKFEKLLEGSYTINVVDYPAGFTSGLPTVGTFGTTPKGIITRNEQISAIETPADSDTVQAGLNYLFGAQAITASGNIQAALANDSAGPGGSFTDGQTGDPAIRGAITNQDQVATFQAKLDAATTFVAIDDNLNPDGSFFLNRSQLAKIAGGTLANGNHTLNLQTLDAQNQVSSTQNITFFLDNPPTAPTQPISFHMASSKTVDLGGTFLDQDFTNSRVQFNTTEGLINVDLFDTQAPKAVANFLNYVTSNQYDSTIFHRIVPGFVLQGGQVASTNNPNLINEFVAGQRSNLRGTVAMAKVGGDPDSATSEFFFNLADNSANLDNQNGGFTVFGQVVGQDDLNVVDRLASHSDNTSLSKINDITIIRRSEALTYTNPTVVSTSPTDVVTASIENNRLKLTRLKGGNATITVGVTATDLSGVAATGNVVFNLVDLPPTISGPNNGSIPAQTTTVGTPTPAISFTVNDLETPPANLTVTTNSSNTNLVPLTGIVLGGSGPDRTVTISPAAGQSGSTTITLTVTDGASLAASTTFTLTVNPANNALTISTIPNQTTPQGSATTALAFTIGDPDTPVGDLVLSAGSSNTNLVPTANVVFGGTGANRTVTTTPVANQSGSATITVTVSNGTDNASTSFVRTVNNPPTISTIQAQTTVEDTPTSAIAFTVDDTETALGTLTLSASSSDTTLVPTANIAFGGTDANRTVTITPAGNKSGSANITLTVNDGTTTASTTFALAVTPVNDGPTIATSANQTTPQGTATAAIPVTVGDVDTAVASLTLSATNSSDITLVPLANVSFGGSGANRTVTVTPVAGQSGTATITLTVSDGTLTTNTNLLLTVNNPPTISSIPAQTTTIGTATPELSFTINDLETPAANLTVTSNSSDTTLVPLAGIVLGGSGSSRTVTVTPAAGLTGSATITLTVTDGVSLPALTTFVLTVS